MAGGDDLKLLGLWASPYVLRVKLALSLKGLSYENVEEDLRDKSELLLKSNPVHQKVPVLIHGGKPICESQVILQYIDEAFAGTGPSLLPADPYERAVARFWAAYIDDKMLPAWNQSTMGKTEEERAEGKKQSVVTVETLEGALRDCGGQGKPFFGGDSVGYVDVVLGGLLGWVRASEELHGVRPFDPERTPLLAAWSERFGALDAVQTVMPDVGRLLEFGKALMARLAAAAAAGASNN
ncbi:glutathione S-transferase42 [Zea mays]|uniref:Glutathione S-transferase n=2 Tax=Zea mays TaxID=4577 RepID=B6T033_MAIZE|nr:glutathione S-transferase42 [Zea mays]ACG30466.1 glutathione S-transferase GSTU6 [Zea mays]ONL99382.1 glutathione transferase42 [Zea mays]|eukprot:NP_001306693.1 glutathione S-transferase42 [Zea mays]